MGYGPGWVMVAVAIVPGAEVPNPLHGLIKAALYDLAKLRLSHRLGLRLWLWVRAQV